MKMDTVVHPFLFGLYPVLLLFSYNASITSVSEVMLPLILIECITSVLWLFLSFVIKDRKKAGIIVSLFILFFFSYGHINGSINGLNILKGDIGNGYYVLSLWGMVFVFTAFMITKKAGYIRNITIFMNVTAVLVIIPSVVTTSYSFASRDKITESVTFRLENPKRHRDIYYIILDGYGRADILNKIYHYDNSEITDFLTKKGFFIADKSRCNYPMTPLSLASSLNFSYLDVLSRRNDEDLNNAKPLIEMIQHNNVARILKLQGYKHVVFSSGYSPTDINKADIYLAPRWSLSEFNNVLINSTPLPILLDMLPLKSQNDLHRDRILYIFDMLASMTETGFPKFVFAHITAPHKPFVFGENGESLPAGQKFDFNEAIVKNDKQREEYIASYRKQVIFISKKTMETINSILSNYHEPPIIIIQADHGPAANLNFMNLEKTDFNERMSILNAYYLPDASQNLLYKDITPVNTFRVILNHYFGANIKILRDESYFSTPFNPYKFLNVTRKVLAVDDNL